MLSDQCLSVQICRVLVQGRHAPSGPAALVGGTRWTLAGVGVEGGREGGRVVELDVPSACAGTGCTVFS